MTIITIITTYKQGLRKNNDNDYNWNGLYIDEKNDDDKMAIDNINKKKFMSYMTSHMLDNKSLIL